jgi:hypothetical protein
MNSRGRVCADPYCHKPPTPKKSGSSGASDQAPKDRPKTKSHNENSNPNIPSPSKRKSLDKESPVNGLIQVYYTYGDNNIAVFRIFL